MWKIYLLNTIYTFLGVQIGPILTYYEGQLFTPDKLSVFLWIANVVGISQFQLNKLTRKQSIIIPFIIAISTTIINLILINTNYVKFYIVLSMICGSIISMFMSHMFFTVTDIIKNNIEIQKFNNILGSYTTIGSLIGLGVSSILLKYINYMLYLSIILTCLIILDVISFFIYYRVFKTQKV